MSEANPKPSLGEKYFCFGRMMVAAEESG